MSNQLIKSYLQLTKARLSALVLLTTAVGFALGANVAGTVSAIAFVGTLLGTALAAGAANALNQIIEIPLDAKMERTRDRPLPSGTLSRRHALAVAIGLGVAGIATLLLLSTPIAAALALLTILLYVLLYTPLKTRSTLNTLVGAVCGAIPPMIGWVGATGTLAPGAWALAGILFIWQIPHFLALAWLYRADYERGGFVMLPVLDRSGQVTCQIVVSTSLMLIPMALTATLLGLAGWIYAAGSVLLGLGMFVLAVWLYRDRTHANARRVFLASLVYLSAVLVLLVADQGPISVPPTIHRLAAHGTAELPATLGPITTEGW